MRKYCKCRKKHRYTYITVTHKHFCEKNDEKIQDKEEDAINQNAKVGFWKAVGKTIVNKEAKNGKRTAMLLAEIMVTVFNAMAILGVLTTVGMVIVSTQQLNWNMSTWSVILQALIIGVFAVTVLITSLIFRAIANEIGAEKDRNYITTLFFGFTSLASLIVALVALFKGVG